MSKYEYTSGWIILRCPACNKLLIEVASVGIIKIRKKCPRCSNSIIITGDGDTFKREIEIRQ